MKISLALGAVDGPAVADGPAAADEAAELDGAVVAAGVLAEAVLGAAAGDDADDVGDVGDVADAVAGVVLAEPQAVSSRTAMPRPDPAMTRMAFMFPSVMDAHRTVLVRSR
jgi:hypothetical protein